MRKGIIISYMAVLIGLSGCSLIPDKIGKSEEIVRTVEVKEVKNETNNIMLDYLGGVIVNDERMLFTEVSGTIDKISVSQGRQVGKGDYLIAVKDSEGKILNLNVDVDGYVKEVLVEQGSSVEAGDPLLIINAYNHRVTLGITSKDIKTVKVGTKANIIIEDITTAGRIALLSPYPDEASRTFPAQIELEDIYSKEDYIVGAVTEVELIVGEEEGIFLDINNVLNEGNQFVYIVENDDRAKKQNITIKGYSKNKVLVEGLNQGDKVIISGTSNLKEGQKVNISNKDEVDK